MLISYTKYLVKNTIRREGRGALLGSPSIGNWQWGIITLKVPERWWIVDEKYRALSTSSAFATGVYFRRPCRYFGSTPDRICFFVPVRRNRKTDSRPRTFPLCSFDAQKYSRVRKGRRMPRRSAVSDRRINNSRPTSLRRCNARSALLAKPIVVVDVVAIVAIVVIESQKKKKKKAKNQKEEERVLFNAPSKLGREAFTPENFFLQNNGYPRVIAFSPLLSLPCEKHTEGKKERERKKREREHPFSENCTEFVIGVTYSGHAPLICMQHGWTSILVLFRYRNPVSRGTTRHDLIRNPRVISPLRRFPSERSFALGCDRSWNRRDRHEAPRLSYRRRTSDR